MLRIGVLGAGHLGKIHIKCIQLIESIELIGFYDPDDTNAAQAIERFGVNRFDNFDELLNEVDIIDIVTPTITHFELAAKAIQAGKHVFIEKPLTHTVEEAEELVRLSEEYEVKVQVGHVERFNPALLSLGDLPLHPMFIEAHRLATFNPRGTDVSVVLDLMIHDLDIVLKLVNSTVKSIQANGVAVVSKTPDISNARIEFENGCVANLTASRISLKQMRKVRFFQKDAYISLDFLDKKAQVIRLYEQDNLPSNTENLMELPTPDGSKYIQINMPETEPTNAIKMEIETFAQSIETNATPLVSIRDGYEALKVAYQIIEQIEQKAVKI